MIARLLYGPLWFIQIEVVNGNMETVNYNHLVTRTRDIMGKLNEKAADKGSKFPGHHIFIREVRRL